MGSPASLDRRRHRRACLAGVAVVAVGACLAGCGDSTEQQSGAPLRWTLVLDYQPNAVHAGLMRAVRAGYFRDAGIALKIVAPSSTSDALTQVSRGKAQLGLADLIDVARRNDRARTSTSATGTAPARVSLVGAIVQEPLSGILVDARSPIRRAADLAGKRIAVTGLPSDEAVVKAIVRNGDKPLATRPITLGFDGLKALHSGRVDGATAYWPADEVTLRQLGTEPRTFSLARDGHVHYPGLVAFAAPTLRRDHPAKLRAFAEALRHGTQDVIASARVGEQALAAAYPELDPTTTAAQLANYRPLFGTATTAGQLDTAALQNFARFAAAAGLTSAQLSPAELRGDDG